MEKEKTKPCKLCLRFIDLSKDNYVQLIDFKEGKLFMEGFYHTICYTEAVRGTKQVLTKVKGMLDKVAKMIGFKEETIIDIK